MKRVPVIMITEDFPLRLHTVQAISCSFKLPNPEGLLLPLTSYSSPFKTSLAYEYGFPLSGSFGKQRYYHIVCYGNGYFLLDLQ